MKYFLTVVIFASFLGGCTSSENGVFSEKNSKTAESSVVDNSVNQKPNINSDASKTLADSTKNNDNQNVKMIDLDSFQSREKMIEKGKNVKVEPIAPNAKMLTAKAADNSEVFTIMNKQGVPIETRIFKNNPLLVKIEKNYANLENPTTKVYLKDGKVIDLPKGKIENITKISAREILAIVGASVPNGN